MSNSVLVPAVLLRTFAFRSPPGLIARVRVSVSMNLKLLDWSDDIVGPRKIPLSLFLDGPDHFCLGKIED